MIIDRRGEGDTPGRGLPGRGWELWTIPLPARGFLLLVEAIAAVSTIMLLLTQAVSTTELIRVAVLAAAAIAYAEGAARVERLKRYLGHDKVFSEQVSVWTFAATLTVPAGWAAALVVLIYTHILVQRRHDESGHPYRVVFTAATIIVSVLAASAVLGAAGDGGAALRGGLLGPAAVLAALLAFTVANFGLVLAGVWLTARPPSLRAMLPDTDTLSYELATLVLGVVTAGLLLHTPVLTPVVVLLVALLHRSSLVNALRHTARTDTKTGLLNLAAWTDHATGVLSRTRRDGRPVTILFCDLDHFKTVNDTHGHLVGDQVLTAVAACLRRELRGHDGLGRFGGEEFVVILDRLKLSEAEQVAARLRTAISSLRFADNLKLTVSIGLAHHQPHHGDADLQQLLARADLALHAAKASGRNRVHTN